MHLWGTAETEADMARVRSRRESSQRWLHHRHTTKRVLSVLPLCLALTAGMTTPAHAEGPASGGLAVSGTVHLPTFPCPLPAPGAQPCVGSFTSTSSGAATATISGTVDGRHENIPWTLALNAPIRSSFTYVDSLPPEPDCVEGLAAGTATFTTPLNNQGFGSYHNAPVPAAIVGASGSFEYQWRRMATGLAFHIENLRLTVIVFGVGSVDVIEDADNNGQGDGHGEGAGTLIPNMSTQTVPDCVQGQTKAINATVTAALRVTTAP